MRLVIVGQYLWITYRGGLIAQANGSSFEVLMQTQAQIRPSSMSSIGLSEARIVTPVG